MALPLFPVFCHWWRRCAALCCTAALLCAAPAAYAVQAASPGGATEVFRLRVVGGLAGVNQFTQWEEPFWTRELQRLSSGRFDADIVPFDRAGIPAAEMLKFLQMGVVPFGTVLLSALSSQYPQYMAVDLAGLNTDMASLRTHLEAFRPYMEQTLREQHGVKLLAVYAYPAQVFFCTKALTGLGDLAGRRIRVSSSTQADFVAALGAVAVRTEFAKVAGAMVRGALDCAITGTSSGNTIGLHRMTSHLYTMPLTWGLAVFGANQAAWNSLPLDLRALLERELPRLEASIWSEAERETTAGIACNSGAPPCPAAQRGQMVVVPVSAQDELRRQQILRTIVLPQWLRRCSVDCAQVWRQTMGLVRPTALPVLPVLPVLP